MPKLAAIRLNFSIIGFRAMLRTRKFTRRAAPTKPPGASWAHTPLHTSEALVACQTFRVSLSVMAYRFCTTTGNFL